MQPRDGGDERPVQPGDIAVLVRYNNQAQLVQSHLHAAGVPVVLTGKTSVFSTPAAAEWQRLLEALEQPHRPTRVRRVALTCFVGFDAARLDAEGDDFADDLALKLRIWGAVLEERGVAAMFEAVSLDQQLQPRILSLVNGERLLTDLRHIAQVMHEAALEGQLGLTALLVWLRRRISEAAGEGGQERSRRLETDADAVQIITVHTSKGLEFPVVMVPFAWDNWGGREPATAVFHDEHDHRVRDVGGPGSPDWAAHVQAAQAGGDRRRAAADLRRADPRAVAPAAVVGAVVQHPDALLCSGCCCTTTRRSSRRCRSPCRTTRRRWRRSARGPIAATAGSASRWCRPTRPRCGHPPSSRRPLCSSRPSPASSTSAGGARPTAR